MGITWIASGDVTIIGNTEVAYNEKTSNPIISTLSTY